MKSQIRLIAGVAFIDRSLDELREEFGDLPEQISSKQKNLNKASKMKDETSTLLKELKSFIKNAKKTLANLKDSEEKLAKKQFQVKNNKEFDAITTEIKHIKVEYEELSLKLRKEAVKEENLVSILADQTKKVKAIESELKEFQDEYDELKDAQGGEEVGLIKKRKKIIKQINDDFRAEYDRIRLSHSDAAVVIFHGSCKGYRVPHQLLVEIRNNLDQIYVEEHSGRIMIPEEVHIDEENISELV